MQDDYRLNISLERLLKDDDGKSMALSDERKRELDFLDDWVLGQQKREWSETDITFLEFNILDGARSFKDKRRKMEYDGRNNLYSFVHQLQVARIARLFGAKPDAINAYLRHDDIEDIILPTKDMESLIPLNLRAALIDYYTRLTPEDRKEMTFINYARKNFNENEADDVIRAFWIMTTQIGIIESTYFRELQAKANRYFEAKRMRSIELSDLFKDIVRLMTNYGHMPWNQHIASIFEGRRSTIKEASQYALFGKTIDDTHGILTTDIKPSLREFWRFFERRLYLPVKKWFYRFRGYQTFEINRQELEFVTNRMESWRDLRQFLGLYFDRLSAGALYCLAYLDEMTREIKEPSGDQEGLTNKIRRNALYRKSYEWALNYTLSPPQKYRIRAKAINFLIEARNYLNSEAAPNSDILAKTRSLLELALIEMYEMARTTIRFMEKYRVTKEFKDEIQEENEKAIAEGEYEKLTIPKPGERFPGRWISRILPAANASSSDDPIVRELTADMREIYVDQIMLLTLLDKLLKEPNYRLTVREALPTLIGK